MKAHGVTPRSRTVMSNLRAIISTIIADPASGFAYMPDCVMHEAWPSSVSDRLANIRLDRQDISWHFSMFRRRGQAVSKVARLFWNSVDKAYK